MTTTTNLIENLQTARREWLSIGECWNLMDEAADTIEAQAKLATPADNSQQMIVMLTEQNKAQAQQIAELQADAELGRIAMRFVDRAGDVADCDPAERICAEFYKAMGDAVDAHCAAAAQKGNV